MAVDLSMLADFGIDLANIGLPSLVKLRDEYESRNASLIAQKDSGDSTDSELKKFLTETVNQDDSVREAVKKFKSAALELLYLAVDSDPRTILPLIDATTEIRQAAMNERDYWIQKVKRMSGTDNAKPLDEDFEEERVKVGEIAELIRKLYGLMPNYVPTTKRGDEFGPKEFPLLASKSGDYLPKLSRLVRSQAEDNPTGKAASNRYLEFRWNGTVLDKGILPTDVAHDYVSSLKDGFVIDWSGIREMLKDTEQNLASPEWWSLDFPTGKLEGRDNRDPKPTRKES
jgi:hypothetical protein